ncbi:guanine nucleotide-binding protein-like 3 homolog isoform X2 [Eurosta solidaginis]|uniref:guanine nucleotide-binding protein-like 3 homolog isoform X2 n=1 Tax=Eurosta solidaginis TaxID=178769 RepID=UPI0035306760
MALKRLKTKKSKRLSGRLKHKIEKKVREHKRKIRRDTKKKPKLKASLKRKLIQIPNICPFKNEALKDIDRSNMKPDCVASIQRSVLNANGKSFKNIFELFDDATSRHEAYSARQLCLNIEKTYCPATNKEQSLKQFSKEFKNVIQNADVILEVVDARDPLGTRCIEVEQAVRSVPGNKKLVLVLNKVDLVPRENLDNWIRYFRKKGPVTVFKASTQEQQSKLGRRKLNHTNTERSMRGSVCIGAELLISMLGNFCRNNGIRTSIRVGVVGIPNVGKSSIINSLTRGKTCAVGCTPGVTKVLQEVELDSKIKLIDCPGVVFPHIGNGNTEQMVLKNAQRVSTVKDPFTLAESILRRASKNYFCNLYDITEYASFEEFFTKKAARMASLFYTKHCAATQNPTIREIQICNLKV